MSLRGDIHRMSRATDIARDVGTIAAAAPWIVGWSALRLGIVVGQAVRGWARPLPRDHYAGPRLP